MYLQPSARLPKPLAYWPCDDVEDDETLEVIRGNDAFVDGASAVPSPCGRGLRFPLTDRPALIEEIDDAPELWTLGLWFKVPDGDADVLRSDGPTIDFRGNRLRFGRFDWDGTREFAARPKPPPGTWIHAAFKHDDAGRLEVHLNGEFLGKTDEIVEESDRPLKNLAVGFQHGGEPGQTLEIDELVVFPVRLDQDQIRRLAKLTSDPK